MKDVTIHTKLVLADQIAEPVETIVTTDKLKDDLNMDSLDIVEFIMACEKEFDISIPDNCVDDVQTVGDLINAIKKLKGQPIDDA